MKGDIFKTIIVLVSVNELPRMKSNWILADILASGIFISQSCRTEHLYSQTR